MSAMPDLRNLDLMIISDLNPRALGWQDARHTMPGLRDLGLEAMPDPTTFQKKKIEKKTPPWSSEHLQCGPQYKHFIYTVPT